MAAKTALRIDQGATYRFSFDWSYNSGTTEEPVWEEYNLDGCSARLEIREKIGGPLLTSVSTEDGGITIEGGSLLVELSAEKTDLLNVKKAVWDCEVTFPGGDVVRVLQGPVLVSLSVTTGEA